MGVEEWALTAVRLWALLRVQVLWRTAIGPSWELVAAGLAVVLAPAVHTVAVSSEDPAASLPIRLLFEFLLGSVLGLVASLPGHALVGAADTSAGALGLPDRNGDGRSPAGNAWRSLTMFVVLAMAVALDLHHPLLASLASLADTWPIGAPADWPPRAGAVYSLPRDLARAAHVLTLLALSLATPVLMSAAVVDLCARTVAGGPVPAGGIADALRPWLRVSLALAALGASWAAFPEAWGASLG